MGLLIKEAVLIEHNALHSMRSRKLKNNKKHFEAQGDEKFPQDDRTKSHLSMINNGTVTCCIMTFLSVMNLIYDGSIRL